MLVLRGVSCLAKKPRPTFGCPSVNHTFNPLWKMIKRNEEFSRLFLDFNGYIEFFFLQDFVDENGTVIRFMPDYFDGKGNFTKKYPVPQTAAEYLKNIKIQKGIIKKRNNRIREFVSA